MMDNQDQTSSDEDNVVQKDLVYQPSQLDEVADQNKDVVLVNDDANEESSTDHFKSKQISLLSKKTKIAQKVVAQRSWKRTDFFSPDNKVFKALSFSQDISPHSSGDASILKTSSSSENNNKIVVYISGKRRSDIDLDCDEEGVELEDEYIGG